MVGGRRKLIDSRVVGIINETDGAPGSCCADIGARKYHRAVRLPEGDLAKARGDGTSKSAVSRRFVALSRKKMKAWLASDLSELDLLVIQIDGLHVGDHVLMAAIGVDGNGDKHVLAVVEGATENTVVVQALIDNLLARGLDPTLPRLFIVDGAKALSKAIRNTFGVAAAIQRCQVHKGRNIIERLPQHLHASVKKALRQAWDQDDANKAERLLRNLARRLEHEEPGVSGSILEGLEEILTVIRLGLPHELRRSLACTNIVENALGTVRQVTRNVKRWRHAEMALRWTAAGLLEAQKTFRRLKAPVDGSRMVDHQSARFGKVGNNAVSFRVRVKIRNTLGKAQNIGVAVLPVFSLFVGSAEIGEGAVLGIGRFQGNPSGHGSAGFELKVVAVLMGRRRLAETWRLVEILHIDAINAAVEQDFGKDADRSLGH